MKNGEFEIGDVVVRASGLDTVETGWLHGRKELTVTDVHDMPYHLQLDGFGCDLFHMDFFDLVKDINDAQ